MEEMSLLSFTRSLNSTLPIRQHSIQRPFSVLQGHNFCPNPDKLLLCQFKDTLAWSTTGITSFKDFSKFRQRKADPKCPLNDVNPLNCTLGI
jgi:hypothetical protein